MDKTILTKGAYMDKITLTKPDDMHLHVRDFLQMREVVNFSAKQMSRAVIMPNLNPPITSVTQAIEYKQRIIDATVDYDFLPLMSLYLTNDTKPSLVKIAKENGIVGFKLYPAGATTNSSKGVNNIVNIYPVLEQMQICEMPLLIHGEVADKTVDIFDREKVFIDKFLTQIVKKFPSLRIVLEHITTKDSVDFVNENNIFATITPQHLLNNRNHLLAGGIRPHYYCLPILKREKHRKALVDAAISGSEKFFLGTDSAPHSKNDKESSCGCAGCFSAPFAIELYAQVFDNMGKLDKLENFSSVFGAKFYNLTKNSEKITLIRKNYKIKQSYDFGSKIIVPYMHGQELDWTLVD